VRGGRGVPSATHAIVPGVQRQALLLRLEEHYRNSGWAVRHSEEELLLASGPGGVTWIGTPLTAEDLASEGIEARLMDLAERRMPGGGELCPLDLLAAEDCRDGVDALLGRLRLSERPHVSVYSAAA